MSKEYLSLFNLAPALIFLNHFFTSFWIQYFVGNVRYSLDFSLKYTNEDKSWAFILSYDNN